MTTVSRVAAIFVCYRCLQSATCHRFELEDDSIRHLKNNEEGIKR